jgi:hypothetical protein
MQIRHILIKDLILLFSSETAEKPDEENLAGVVLG